MVEPWKVQVRFEDSWRSGLLSWSAEGPFVELDSGEEITSGALVKLNQEAILDENGKSSVRHRNEYIISLEPVLVREGTFAPLLDEPVGSSIYPPETNLWYTRLLRGNKMVTFFLHIIEESAKYYLAIVHDCRLIQAHAIRKYEAGALRYETNAELWRKGWAADAPDFDALTILDKPRPEWKCIDRLTDGIRIPIRGETVAEAFDELIPPQWPSKVRQEIKAFFAHICRGRPDEDPLDFFPRFQKYMMLYGMLLSHYRSRIHSADTYPYARWMWQTQSQQLHIDTLAFPEETEQQPWHAFRNYMYDRTLTFERAAKITEKLNKSGKVITKLPVSREEAEESQDAWIERIWMMAMGLRIWPHVRAPVLGLQEAVYIGRAQRWPHKHLRIMARLEDSYETPRYFHHMMIPPLAFQKVKATIHDLSSIAFSVYSANYHLYNVEERQWRIDWESLESRENMSLDDLKRRFGRNKQGFIGPLSKKQAIILDYIVSKGWLSAIELHKGIPGTDIDQDTLERFLTFMRDGKALDLTYRVSPYGLPLTFLEVEGEESAVCSLMSTLLDTVPTCSVLTEPGGNRSYAIVRCTEHDRKKLLKHITSTDYEVRMSEVSAFRSFTHRFFQRIVTEDGWDKDVDEILTQKFLH
ncbi:MAG: hypothetical protein KGY80_07620 [Candidatus Thorarchaeota archaeon]|nr:hypothetical protein [Candidatus Thorarchaeota archaeon]